jgi:HSP20 family protein
MSTRDGDIDEWFRRWWTPWWPPWWGAGSSRRATAGGDIFREFEGMRQGMTRMFEETVRDIDKVPKDLIREYDTPNGERVREVGPLVYGYSMTVGPDGKPKVKEFGNVRSLGGRVGGGGMTPPALTAEREPLADVITTDKDIKVTVEMPGISKQDIKINVQDGSVEISTIGTASKKYRRSLELPQDADLDTAKSTYTNGILEISFKKKDKTKGKELKIE